MKKITSFFTTPFPFFQKRWNLIFFILILNQTPILAQPCNTSLAGFQYLGEINNHNYFLSDNIANIQNAQAVAQANNGYLAVISNQAENDFLQQNISGLVYIGLNDAQTEGELVWGNGESFSYSNFDICSFCNENADDLDYVVMHSWDGGWSFSSQWNQRKYIVEVPCGTVQPNDFCGFYSTVPYEDKIEDCLGVSNTTGNSYTSTRTGNQITITANNANSQIWSKTFPILGAQAILGTAIIKELNNEVLVFGQYDIFVPGVIDRNAFILKLDINGNKIWRSDFDIEYDAFAISIFEQSMDGGYYLSRGRPNSGGGVPATKLVKVDNLGNLEWENSVAGFFTSFDFLGESPDGNKAYIKTFTVQSASVIITQFDATNGDVNWSRNPSAFDPGQSVNNVLENSAVLDANGNTIVAYYWKYTSGNLPVTDGGTVLAKINETGDILWRKRLPRTYDRTIVSYSCVNDSYILTRPNGDIFNMDSDGNFDPYCEVSTFQSDLYFNGATKFSGLVKQIGESFTFTIDIQNSGHGTATGDFAVDIHQVIGYPNNFTASASNYLETVYLSEIPFGVTEVEFTLIVPSTTEQINHFAFVLDSDDEVNESNENNNINFVRYLTTPATTGGCPTSLSGFTALGEFNGNAYFLSDEMSRPVDAQDIAVLNGGNLVVINNQAENDFLQQHIDGMVYIGLNDAQSEGNNEWVDGSTSSYENFDFCSFCNENSNNLDYVVMHTWNGGWSFSSVWNQRKYIVEIPCPVTLTTPNNVNNTLIALPNPNEAKFQLGTLLPNPAKSMIHLGIIGQGEITTELQIFNMQGQQVLTKSIELIKGSQTVDINIEDLPAGMYYLVLPEMANQIKGKRFIKIL